jgi:hypothetical protein
MIRRNAVTMSGPDRPASHEMFEKMPAKIFPYLPAAALALLTLAACSGNDEDAARFLVAPGKFALYNCDQIAQQARDSLKRQRELEALMVKVGTGAGGQMVTAAAYRPEYLTLVGEMDDLRRQAGERNCKFVPDENPGAGSTSGRTIR